MAWLGDVYATLSGLVHVPERFSLLMIRLPLGPNILHQLEGRPAQAGNALPVEAGVHD